jgi:hypothetical protein
MKSARLIRSAVFVMVYGAALGMPGPSLGDEIPKFDVSRTCRAESANAPTTQQSCVGDERSAHEQMSKQWSQFASSDKASCIQAASDISGVRSYVELLTCLELARDTRKLREQ